MKEFSRIFLNFDLLEGGHKYMTHKYCLCWEVKIFSSNLKL